MFVALFVVEVSSVAGCVGSGVDGSLFVDDFGVSCRARHMHAVEGRLRLHLGGMKDWADSGGFGFSQSRTVCVHFC